MKPKPSSSVKQVLQAASQPCSSFNCYFWNVAFVIIDQTLDFLDPQSYPNLSLRLAESVQAKLCLFMGDLQKAFKAVGSFPPGGH